MVRRAQTRAFHRKHAHVFRYISIRRQLLHTPNTFPEERLYTLLLWHALTTTLCRLSANGNVDRNITIKFIITYYSVEIWNFISIWQFCIYCVRASVCVWVLVDGDGDVFVRQSVSQYERICRNLSMKFSRKRARMCDCRATQNRWCATTVGRLIALSHPKIWCNSIIIWRIKIQHIQFMLIYDEQTYVRSSDDTWCVCRRAHVCILDLESINCMVQQNGSIILIQRRRGSDDEVDGFESFAIMLPTRIHDSILFIVSYSFDEFFGAQSPDVVHRKFPKLSCSIFEPFRL